MASLLLKKAYMHRSWFRTLALSLLMAQVVNLAKAEAGNPIARIRSGINLLRKKFGSSADYIGLARGTAHVMDADRSIGGHVEGAGITVDVDKRPITILGLGNDAATAKEPFIQNVVAKALRSIDPELLRDISVVTVDPRDTDNSLPLIMLQPGVIQISKNAFRNSIDPSQLLAIEMHNAITEYRSSPSAIRGDHPELMVTSHGGTAMQLRGEHVEVSSGLAEPNLKNQINRLTKSVSTPVSGQTRYEFQSGHSLEVVDRHSTYGTKPTQGVVESLQHLPHDVLEEIKRITLVYDSAKTAAATDYVKWTGPGQLEIRPQLRMVQKRKALDRELTNRLYRTVLDNNQELKKKYW